VTGPRLAIVIPFYQREPGILRKAVDSVLLQADVDNVQIIIVDDGSPVSPREELRDLIDQDDGRIRLLVQENAGPGAARNMGLDHVPAGTEYAAFLDSDNVWSGSHLENAIAALEAGADFYFADVQREWEDDTVFALYEDRLPASDLGPLIPDRQIHEYRGDYEAAVLNNLVRTSSVVYRYAFFPDARFVTDISCSEDQYFWLTVGRRARMVAISLNCESISGLGVNLYASISRRTVGWVRVLCDEITFLNRCLAIPDLGERARELSLHYRAGFQRDLGEELLYHLLRGRAVLVAGTMWRYPGVVADMARAAPKPIARFRQRVVRRARRYLSRLS
jgi:succinoglycan biosynthesis protein ExoW